jgi:hypothetical protein
LNTRLVPEIALVAVAMSEVVAKAGEQVLKLRGPDGDLPKELMPL